MKDALRRFHVPDLLLFMTILFLAGLGLVMVYSASSVTALDDHSDSWFYLKRQAAFVAGGLVLMFLILASDYRRWVKAGGWILIGSIASLLLIHVPGFGVRVNGALRWLSLGGFRFQPAEFAKLACILYLSSALVRKGLQVRSFTYGLLPLGLVAGALSGLIFVQKDLGNAVLLILLTGVLIFIAGAKISYLIGGVALLVPVVWLAIAGEAFRMRRIMAFLNPWDDPQNTSYQIVQSFTAFFSGGLWGRGLANSQEKLHYLPEVHTDFIASVVGEELGFIGVTLLVAAFVFFLLRGYRIAQKAVDPMGFFLAVGCTTLIGLQALINLCVVTGLVPTKGLPLPFISHGGSALLATFMACGLLLSVSRESLYLDEGNEERPWFKRWSKR